MLKPGQAAAVADAFGLRESVGLVGPVARGQLGQVWRLETASGPYAVKEWFAEPDVEDAARQARFSERAREAGVRTPHTVRTPDGRVVTHVDGLPVRVFEWVDLMPRSRWLDPGAVGEMLAVIHGVAVPSGDEVGQWFSGGVGAEGWRTMLDRVAVEAAPFASELASLVDELIAVETVIEPHESPRLCHRDLWADNVLAGADGRVWVVDFENMGPADPSQELAMVLFEFGADRPERARRLHDAYVRAGGPGRVTRRGHFTMLVAEQAHIGHYACSSWLAAEDPQERERLAAWFGEIPEDPVTLARIDRILAAVTPG